MPLLEIDGRSVEVAEGSTILDAARKLGVDIPYLCFMEGYGHFTSCMMCVIKEKTTNRLLPACSAPISEGMVVETENREVVDARRDALELLLKEHIGDCEGPCRLACPAHMNIPAALRLAETGKIAETAAAFKNTTLFPAILGRICRAPCEKACRRGHFDSPLSIKLLERLSGDRYINDRSAERGPRDPSPVNAHTDKKVAVIGSGPAGLSASFYLTRQGHSVTVFEKRDLPGGMLRYEIGKGKLPRKVLNSEIDYISSAGLLLRLSTEVGVDVSMDELNQSFDAVVIASGENTRGDPGSFGVAISDRGISVNRSSFETDKRGVFVCGGAVRPLRMAARSVFEGRSAAYSVSLFLDGGQPSSLPKTFNSIIGKLKEGEIGEFLKEASEPTASAISENGVPDITEEEVAAEAGRCLRCDCAKAETCLLRKFAEQYRADRLRYKSGERKNFSKDTGHEEIIFEPGKCIKCGRCVRITEKAGERLGLSFIGRGFDIFVGVPFNEPLSKGLEKVQKLCVENCPTGALAFRRKPIRHRHAARNLNSV